MALNRTDSKPRRVRRSGRSGGQVTLEMVAEASGVSPSTVSRILNGTASRQPREA
jgi:LacI family transcriptional regulator